MLTKTVISPSGERSNVKVAAWAGSRISDPSSIVKVQNAVKNIPQMARTIGIALPATVLVVVMLACGSYAPRPPTPGAAPTFTPTTAPATAAPAIDTIADDYRDGILEQGREIAESIQVISRLMQDPKLTDNGWVMEMGVSIARIEIAKDEIGKLSPPPELAEFHDAMLGASATCANFATTLSSAIDNQNSDDLTTAVGLLEACGNQLNEANTFLP